MNTRRTTRRASGLTRRDRHQNVETGWRLLVRSHSQARALIIYIQTMRRQKKKKKTHDQGDQDTRKKEGKGGGSHSGLALTKKEGEVGIESSRRAKKKEYIIKVKRKT